MENENQNLNRIEKYLLWGLPFLLALMVALNLLFTYLLDKGWSTSRVPRLGYPTSLAFDSSGGAWIGTHGGLAHFNGEEWIHYVANNSGLSSLSISSISIDSSDNIWIGTVNRLNVFNGEAWRFFYTPFLNIVSTAIDPTGNLWIGGEGVAVFDGEDWTRYTQANSGLVSDEVNDIAFDPSGNVWIGTTEGVSVFDGEDWTSYTQANSDLVDNRVTAIAAGPSGVIWVGTQGGLSVFDGQHWLPWAVANSRFIHREIRSIAIDSSGNVWVAAFNDGVSYFDGENWTSYSRYNSGLGDTHFGLGENNVRVIAPDLSENVWFGFWQGISILDPDQAISIPPWLMALFEYFFSPISIWITSVSLVILWFAIKDGNKFALVSPIGWVLALLLFDPHTLDNEGIVVAIVSNVIAIGALLIVKIVRMDKRRQRIILKRILIVSIIALILGALYYFIAYTILFVG